jgi:hypothetical protein
MPELVVEIFREKSFFDVMDELEVPRKKAKAWWDSGKADPLGEGTYLKD